MVRTVVSQEGGNFVFDEHDAGFQFRAEQLGGRRGMHEGVKHPGVAGGVCVDG
jgi:hypothetical protein